MKAMADLGKAYHHGLDNVVEKNIEKAIAWYKKAAEEGDVSACTALASIYLFGLYEGNIPKDADKGAKYLLLAFDCGAKSVSLLNESKQHTLYTIIVPDKSAAIDHLTRRGDVDPSLLKL